MKKVALELKHKSMRSDNYLIKYGVEGDDFYIIVEGEVSVWVPVPPEQIVKPLEKFKERVKSAILAKSADTIPLFQFHIEPFKTDRRPAYCSFFDFTYLCAKETPHDMA